MSVTVHVPLSGQPQPKPGPVLKFYPTFVGADEFTELNNATAQTFHLFNLYQIEALRYARLDNVDLMVAWQYGQRFSTPWRDNRYMVEDFKEHNHVTLRKFIGYKLFCVIENLMIGLQNFENDSVYQRVPLDPGTIQSIVSNLNEVLTDNNLAQGFMHEHEISDIGRASVTRHYRGAYMGLEAADRLLVGVWDTHREEYLSQVPDKYSSEVDSNAVYMCMHRLVERLLKPLFIAPEPARQRKYYDHYGLWACVFSILYRLFMPKWTVDFLCRLDTLYDRMVEYYDSDSRLRTWARRFSGLPIEAAIGTTMRGIELCPCLLHDHVLDTGNSLTAIYPSSLTEKYLVAQQMFARCTTRMPHDEQ